MLPVGFGRFVPCSIGANHCRLRHIGWEKRGHGLTSRPRESASEPFLNELFGTLSLSSWVWASFACWLSSPWLFAGPPTWRLPVSGHGVDLVAACVGAVREDIVDGAAQEVLWVSGSGPGRKKIH